MIGVVIVMSYVVVGKDNRIVKYKKRIDAYGYAMAESYFIRQDSIFDDLEKAKTLAKLFDGIVYEYKGETNIMELKDLKANLTLEGIEEMIDKLNELKALLVEANKLLSDIGSSQIDVDITVN